MKKQTIILAVVLILILGTGVFFFINNQKDLNIDNQDLSLKKFSSSIFEENNEF